MSISKDDSSFGDLEKKKGFLSDAEEPVTPEVDETEYTTLSWVNRWAARLKAETKGVSPVREDECNDSSLLNAASMWFSANLVIAAFAVGVLSTAVFQLTMLEAALATILFSFMGLSAVAFFSVFGAEFGLRQMILSRYLMGNVTARIFCLINVIACVGWASVNTIASTTLLHMINPTGHRCPPWAASLVIVMSTVLVTFFGYRVIHAYEKWSWVPNLIVFLIIIARLAIAGEFTAGSSLGGKATAGAFLSYGSIVFGFASGWTTYAADYTVYMPKESNKFRIFFSMVAGLATPLLFTLILGAAAGRCVHTNPVWGEYYKEHSVGGLCFAILADNALGGFGQFCCVVLAMSTVANNIPNMYSIALSTQALWSRFARVPRVAWTLLGNMCSLIIAIVAYYKFETFMTSFMDSIGYYLSIYIAVCVTEHFAFRKGFRGYQVSQWDRPDLLPIGYAGCAALCAGAVGVAMGMSHEYYTAPLAKLAGGDIGFLLAAGFSFIVYICCRPLELKYIGR
ncbi:AaceriADL074Wp [[Ashbya] aceris (nom. inval.)]|nr:AaceriADL074Wp [[Ashbya] aceris (nom. inval.)]